MLAGDHVSELLAALAGLAAASASLAGFIPGLYRDRPIVIAQSHGYDIGNLIAVLVLALGLTWSARGSSAGRLVALGALGCLLYGYVTYAFVIVLNPATTLYIAVLACGVWSLATGLATVGATPVGRVARRSTGVFFIVLSLLFGLNWLSQIAESVFSGRLPAELAAAGWPMNPVYVLDLGFVLPLMLLTGVSLLRSRPAGARYTVPLLVFTPLLAVSIVAMAIAQALDGQSLVIPMVALFVAVAAVSCVLAGAALTDGSVDKNGNVRSLDDGFVDKYAAS